MKAISKRSAGWASSLLLAGLLAPSICARSADTGPARASVTYRKLFKSSFPEFVEIKLFENGSGTYDIRQLDDDASPQPFEVSQPLAQKIFALAAQLHHFQNVSLDVHRRIANLGQKTFRYEKGKEAYEVSFNYTIDATATQLLQIFEGLARQETDLDNLQRAMRYDRLGVNDVLMHVDNDFKNKLFPEPERLLPALDQVASDDHYLDIARQRARGLAERIRNPH
jgi:hypothetical protein